MRWTNSVIDGTQTSLICTAWLFLAFTVRFCGGGRWKASFDNDDGWTEEAFFDDCESGKAWCEEKLKQCCQEFTAAVQMDGAHANITEDIQAVVTQEGT